MHNPLYRKSVKFVKLSPEETEWIVFWSRNYSKFLEHRVFFDSYKLFFHFTLVSFHHLLEKQHISPTVVGKQAEILSNTYGGDHIIWRYDPIIFWQDGDNVISNFNGAEFSEYCRLFSALGVKRCYFSFATHYPKFIKRFHAKYPSLCVIEPDTSCVQQTIEIMKNHAVNYGVELFSCCNNNLIDDIILPGSCISGTLLNGLSGNRDVSVAKSPTRKDCGCTRSIDIGDYVNQPCYFGCIYCYANPVWK